MSDIVDALSQVSTTSRARLAPQAVDIVRLAREVACRLAAEQTVRAVEFVATADTTVRADPEQLRTLLWHLLSNAWKFTAPVPSPRVELRCVREGDHVLCCVRDNGVGFDTRHADLLFEPFRRLHPPGTFAGTGVGLALVRRIVRRHGGRIWAESRLGEGAAVFFTLPAA